MSDAWIEGLDLECNATCRYEESGLKRSVFLRPEEAPKAAARLAEAGFFIEDISVLDTADGLLATYHFDHFECPGRIALRVVVPHEDPKIPSISAIYPGAAWHERECHDFFGLEFTDHPNLIPLLIPDDMTEHPLLKEETRRKGLAELVQPGTIETCSTWFKGLFPDPDEKEDGEGPDGAETP